MDQKENVYNREPTVAAQEHVIFTCQRCQTGTGDQGDFRGGESDRFVSAASERAPTSRTLTSPPKYLIPPWSEHSDEAGRGYSDYDYRYPDSRLNHHSADFALRAKRSHGMCCF
jgi:hypothetical protein